MRKLIFGLLFGIIGGVLLAHRLTDGICVYGEPVFMPDCRDMKPFDALGVFAGSTENGALFQLLYLRNAASFLAKNAMVSVEAQGLSDGKIYYVSAAGGSSPGSYRALALEEYDGLVFDFMGFYDVCWEYECKGEIPWRKKEGQKRFFLRRMGGSYTSGAYPPSDILAKGNLSALTLFLYDGKPVSNDEEAELKSAIRYVGEWYSTKAKTVVGDEILNMKIRFYARQLAIQGDYNPCSAGAVRHIASEVPETKNYDIIALVHILGNLPRCPPHPSGNVISLYIKADQLKKSDVDTLVRSFAHEITHLFGASDKYTGVKEWEAGIRAGCKFEPKTLGRDIMCHRVPEEEFIGYINPPLEELTIAEPTARELGWYDGDEDGMLEVIDPCPLDGRNICADGGAGT